MQTSVKDNDFYEKDRIQPLCESLSASLQWIMADTSGLTHPFIRFREALGESFKQCQKLRPFSHWVSGSVLWKEFCRYPSNTSDKPLRHQPATVLFICLKWQQYFSICYSVWCKEKNSDLHCPWNITERSVQKVSPNLNNGREWCFCAIYGLVAIRSLLVSDTDCFHTATGVHSVRTQDYFLSWTWVR